jgi:hypothetical protein
MGHQYWFGVKVEFMCPSCCVTSIERDTLNSTTNDFFKLKSAIDRQIRRCQYCAVVLPDGTDVDVQIVPGTLESLIAQGFQDPRERGYRETDSE